MNEIKEATKRPRATKEDETPKIESIVASLISNGVPLLMAVFHKTVRSISTEPEMAFFDISHEPKPRPSKEAKLWLTPVGVVAEQSWRINKETKHWYKIIPLANVADTIVK